LNKAKIITAEEAGISNKNISQNALNVVQSLQEQGYQAYLVGGCVRDLLLEKKPKDFDVSTNATPEQIKATFNRNARIIGRRFKIVHVRFGYEVIEVATFRADANDRSKVSSHEMTEGDQGQLLRDNVYGTIEEDVVRRDFRVNALYYDSVKGEILDFMNGIDDIRAGKLVSIGEPKTRFTEDPVRMLRVIRFSAKLGFEMEPEALEMIEQEGKLLSHVSSARLFEEVLKLFHGGAAYETYLLLRKYGIFKYLFPFTDQVAVEGVEGMPERALQNTDKRVRAGKPVIPAFLFACMMWDPVKADAQMLMDDGTPEAEAWRVAMSDGLRDQNQYVAVPRRLAEIILDIWNIHFRLMKRNPRMVKASLGNRRFRAAYDFLLLRTMVHEVDEEISEWWTEIQELDAQGRDEMITELNESHKNQGQSENGQDGELDGNSINYNSLEYQNGNSGSQGNSVGKSKAKTGQRKQQNGRRKPTQGKQRGRQAKNPNANAEPGNGNNAQQADPNKPKSNPRRGKKRNSNRGKGTAATADRGNGGGRGPSNRGGRRRDDQAPAGRYQEARPKDDYGNHSTDESTQKKVKVRHKRRVAGTGTADEDKPVF
jgi:poly(A) polymerase